MSSRTHPRSPGSRWGTVTRVAAALIVALLGWGLFSVWSNLQGLRLCYALEKQNTAAARWAVTWGADVNYGEGRDHPPLVLAYVYDRQMVPVLLQSSRIHLHAHHPTGFTALRNALVDADAAVVQQIIDAEVRLRQEPTGQEERLLRAALRGRRDLVEALLARGVAPDATVADAPVPSGVTPLFGAALMGRVEVVGLLVACGADVNRTCFERYPTQRSVLQAAALGGVPTFRALLESGGERLTAEMLSASLAALMYENDAVVDLLLQPPYEGKLSTAALRDTLSFARLGRFQRLVGPITDVLRRRGVGMKPRGAPEGRARSRNR